MQSTTPTSPTGIISNPITQTLRISSGIVSSTFYLSKYEMPLSRKYLTTTAAITKYTIRGNNNKTTMLIIKFGMSPSNTPAFIKHP